MNNFELPLPMSPRICARCGARPVYRDIETMDWCEECLWDFLREDFTNTPRDGGSASVTPNAAN